MLELGSLSLWDRIEDEWETRKGLFFSLILVLLAYFGILGFFGSWFEDYNKLVFWVVLPIVVSIFVIALWWYTTNRFFIKSTDDIVAGIILITDEKSEKQIVSKAVKKVIHHINNSNSFSKISLKMLPTNLCRTVAV